MSVKVSAWVWHSEECAELNGNALVLMLALADVADDNGACRFVADDSVLKYEGLASKVRVDRRTIERLIPKLRELGLVEHIPGSKGRPNEVRIVVPWGPRFTDNLSENEDSSADNVSGNEPDSPTAVHEFTDTVSVRTSYRRKDVGGARKRTPREATTIPDIFVVTAEMREWAETSAPAVLVDRETDIFVRYWREGNGKGKRHKDWVATWKNWLLKTQTDAERRGWQPPSSLVAPRNITEERLARERALVGGGS